MSDSVPFDEPAEAAILGCIASRPDLLDELRLTEEHFFHFAHRQIFGAALALHKSGSPVNTHTLASSLTDLLPKIGGVVGLTNFIRSVAPSSAASIFDRLDCLCTLRRAQNALLWASTGLTEAIQFQEPMPFVTELKRRVLDIEDAGGAEESILPDVVREIHAKLDRMDRGENSTGFQTSIDVWNTAFGGIVEGQFYAIAGRPGRGKTAMAEQIIGDYMKAKLPIVVFEKDMSPQKLVERIVCRYVGVPFWKLMRGMTNAQDRKEIRDGTAFLVERNHLRLYSPAGLTAEQMCAIMRRERRRGAACGILDHIQCLKVGRDMREGLTQASLTIRRHVTETGMPFIALAHLNREAGGKSESDRPSPKNIKEFDQLYGDVDGLVILWYAADQSDKATKEIKFTVAKNRDFNETEETVIFDGAHMTFKGRAMK